MGLFDSKKRPFDGMLDLNRDGKIDLGERWISHNIFEECTKDKWREKRHSDAINYGLDPKDYKTEKDFDEAIEDIQYESDLYFDTDVEDESDIDDEDYDEEEYEDEDYEDEDYEDEDYEDEDYEDEDYEDEDYEDEEYEEEYSEDEYDDGGQRITIELLLGIAEDESEEDAQEIKEEDYPNRRRYLAAKALLNDPWILDETDEYGQRKKAACEFILEQADSIIAANYFSHESGFIYAQAIKDHFQLPCALPDEDEWQEMSPDEIFCKLAKRDIPLTLQIWNWCVEMFFFIQ